MASTRISANARAAGGSIKFLAYVIIVLVVLYSDVMFVSLMWSAFPGGFLTIAAVGGAFATGLSIIALVIGKSHWFRPGGQLLWAWAFTGIEVAISIMNVVLSVMVARGTPLGYLATYLMLAPASPIVALIGWIVILYLDNARRSLHEQMEMDDDLAEAEREHKRSVHAARMDLKQTALEQQKEYLKMHLSSADVQRVLSEGSYEIARGIVSEIIQRPIMPGRSPQIVDSTAERIDTNPRQPAVMRNTDKVLTPRPMPSIAQQRKAQRLDRLTRPKLQAVKLTETKETIAPPLASGAKKPLQVARKGGAYIVNKKPFVPIKTND